MGKRTQEARAMHEAGATYEDIGKHYGVSKQRAHQICTCDAREGTHYHPKTVERIPYIGLREWMIKNRVSVKELGDLSGREVFRKSYNRYGLTKASVDAILRVTGLTYEECFREEVSEDAG